MCSVVEFKPKSVTNPSHTDPPTKFKRRSGEQAVLVKQVGKDWQERVTNYGCTKSATMRRPGREVMGRCWWREPAGRHRAPDINNLLTVLKVGVSKLKSSKPFKPAPPNSNSAKRGKPFWRESLSFENGGVIGGGSGGGK
ncbi:hypothetical protein B0H14DRAFT_2564480 [Mycena olivaceomarginata]|nr:hypothetical protein B0H14DRAFT_2564480 [Mycena olivaceomarginata]